MKKIDEKTNTLWWAIQLAWELGFTITVPLVACALAGRYLDSYFSTSPLFLLTGILASLTITSWFIYRKIVKILS